jgi:hypothetical protein
VDVNENEKNRNSAPFNFRSLLCVLLSFKSIYISILYTLEIKRSVQSRYTHLPVISLNTETLICFSYMLSTTVLESTLKSMLHSCKSLTNSIAFNSPSASPTLISRRWENHSVQANTKSPFSSLIQYKFSSYIVSSLLIFPYN